LPLGRRSVMTDRERKDMACPSTEYYELSDKRVVAYQLAERSSEAAGDYIRVPLNSYGKLLPEDIDTQYKYISKHSPPPLEPTVTPGGANDLSEDQDGTMEPWQLLDHQLGLELKTQKRAREMQNSLESEKKRKKAKAKKERKSKAAAEDGPARRPDVFSGSEVAAYTEVRVGTTEDTSFWASMN